MSSNSTNPDSQEPETPKGNRFWMVVGTFLFVIVLVEWIIPAVSRSITGLPFPLTVPSTLSLFYVVLTLIALFLFVTFSDENLEEFWRPIRRFLAGDFGKLPLLAALLLVPIIIGWQVYETLRPTMDAPIALRIQHPSSNFPKSYEELHNPHAQPTEADVQAFVDQARDDTVDFIPQVEADFEMWSEFNPDQPLLAAIGTPPIKVFLTALAGGEVDPETARTALIEKNLFEGRALYAMNCRPCHGDSVSGDGPMADGFKLRPINFTDQGTIETIVEGYTFWRVENGGPGLPTEATPWDSAMPEWKLSLTEDERWKIIMAEYDLAEKTPRIPESE